MTSRPHSRINGGSLKVAAALVAIAACDSGEMTGPVPGVPASVAVAPDSAVLTYLGETAQFTARVTDGTGASVGGVVRWESTDRAVVTVDGSGLVTARGNGTAEVRASAGGASDAAPVRVEQRVATLRVFGDGQSALAGLSLPASVGVAVLDGGDRPVAGTVVRFAVSAGGGSVEPDSVVSDGSGVASAVWMLGVAPGEQRLVASAATGPEAAITALAVDPNSVVARVVPWSGDRQWGLVGQRLQEPVVVQALDEAGRPVPGALVSFTPEPGSGSAEPDSVRSDSAGLARAEWTLGATIGDHRLGVSVAGAVKLELTATAQPDAGVCGRTRAVITELLRQSGVAHCAGVTEHDLALIEYMILSEKNIESLRGGDFANLTQLHTLFLGGNRLSALPPDIFAGLDSLRVLKLSQNELESLPPGLLAGLPSLTDLNLLSNRLTEVPPDIAGIAGLRDLDLSFNPLANLPSDLFANLTSLQTLRLAGVGLEELPPEMFAGLSELGYLRLSANRLARLPVGIFDNLSSLGQLDLTRNRLTELPLGVFRDTRALKVLSVAENDLDRLDEAVFSGLSSLTELYLYRNHLTELPAGLFAGLSGLESLSLFESELAELPAGLFAGLSRLRWLFLHRNQLTALPAGIFGGLSRLEVLRLGGNGLATLPAGLFEELASLRELDLAYNALAELPPGVFLGLSTLESVGLLANPGAPFPVALDLTRVDVRDVLAPGPASVVLRVPLGAPVSFEASLSVQGGTASGGSFAVAAGDTVSTPLEVSPSPGSSGPVYVSLGLPPTFPLEFEHLAWVAGEQVVLFAPAVNRTPVVTRKASKYWLQAGVQAAELDLGAHFRDPNGDTLIYEAATSDGSVVAGTVEGGLLVLEPLSAGSAVVEVTAADSDGLQAKLDVPVTVARAPDPDGYQIELIFGDGFTEMEEAEIRRAATRWMELVTADLPEVPIDRAGFCRDLRGVRLVGRIDDVVIGVSVEAEGRARLASASACARRESGLPFMGDVRFNRDYFPPDRPQTGSGSMYTVALHEIGHVLGIGTVWRDILREPTRGGVVLDTHFPGPLAVEAFNEAGGRPYAGGKVPVETYTRWGPNVHWRRGVLDGEVMTAGGTALSAITLQALADLGYEVDVSRADSYELPTPDAASAADVAAESPFAGDVIEGPVFVVDENGEVVRIIRN